jgi:endonuclease/exonuclease/phosphatase family metal-dependent hydrolase
MSPLARGATFPAHAPREQIDHILTTSGLGPARGRAVELPLSDHRALLADL